MRGDRSEHALVCGKKSEHARCHARRRARLMRAGRWLRGKASAKRRASAVFYGARMNTLTARMPYGCKKRSAFFAAGDEPPPGFTRRILKGDGGKAKSVGAFERGR